MNVWHKALQSPACHVPGLGHVMTASELQLGTGQFRVSFGYISGCCMMVFHCHVSLFDRMKTGERLTCAECAFQVTVCCACRQWPQPPPSLTAKMRTMMFLRWQSSFPAAAVGGKGQQDLRQQGRASVAPLVTGLPQPQMKPSQGQSIWLLLAVCMNCEACNCTVTVEHMHLHARCRNHLCSGWT